MLSTAILQKSAAGCLFFLSCGLVVLFTGLVPVFPLKVRLTACQLLVGADTHNNLIADLDDDNDGDDADDDNDGDNEHENADDNNGQMPTQTPGWQMVAATAFSFSSLTQKILLIDTKKSSSLAQKILLIETKHPENIFFFYPGCIFRWVLSKQRTRSWLNL